MKAQRWFWQAVAVGSLCVATSLTTGCPRPQGEEGKDGGVDAVPRDAGATDDEPSAADNALGCLLDADGLDEGALLAAADLAMAVGAARVACNSHGKPALDEALPGYLEALTSSATRVD
jgi:hypothetical protein